MFAINDRIKVVSDDTFNGQTGTIVDICGTMYPNEVKPDDGRVTPFDDDELVKVGD